MNKRIRYNAWVLIVIAAGFGATVLAQEAEPPAKPKEVESALQKAQKQEAATRIEERSREMARSATREIARSERRRAEDALKNWRAAEAALKDATTKGEPKARVDALRTVAEERAATRRSTGERLIADTIAANGASRELFVLEMALRDKMAATRTVELVLQEDKVKKKEDNVAPVDTESELTEAAKAAIAWLRKSRPSL